MDHVIIKGLEVFAYHGVNPEEKRDGQPFLFDVDMSVDLSAAWMDDLSKTVNYAAVCKRVRAVATEKSCDLIECVADRVAKMILAEFAVHEVTVTVKKPAAPMSSKVEYVAVQITRSNPNRRSVSV